MTTIDLDWKAEHFASRTKRITNSFCNFRTEGDVVYSDLSSSVETVKYCNSLKTFSLGYVVKKGNGLSIEQINSLKALGTPARIFLY